ncbi:MAG: hypothetical protein ACFFFG_17500 [Candidatus Thorarchaeota archaeon]
MIINPGFPLQRFIKELVFFSTLPKLLVVSSVLIFGMEMADVFLASDLTAPQAIDSGENIEQIIPIGRGQVLTLEAWTKYSLRLTITSNHAYQENQIRKPSLYDRSGNRFSYTFTAPNYTILFLFWNNTITREVSSPNQIDAHIAVSGFDFDIFTVGSFLMLLGFLLEMTIRILRRLSRKESTPSKHPESRDHRSGQIMKYSKSPRVVPSRPRNAYLLIRKESGIFPTYPLFILLVFTFIIADPIKKPVILAPNPKVLALGLLSGWGVIVEGFLVVWTGILVLIAVEIWKTRLETKSFQLDASLPFNRTTYAAVLFILLSISSSFVLVLPFLVVILINIFRFLEIPDLATLTIFLLWLITWELLVLLNSGTICFLFTRNSLYINLFLVFSSILVLTTLVEVLTPKLILPFPNKIRLLVDFLTSGSLTLDGLGGAIFGSLFLLLGSTTLYNLAINRLEVD